MHSNYHHTTTEASEAVPQQITFFFTLWVLNKLRNKIEGKAGDHDVTFVTDKTSRKPQLGVRACFLNPESGGFPTHSQQCSPGAADRERPGLRNLLWEDFYSIF